MAHYSSFTLVSCLCSRLPQFALIAIGVCVFVARRFLDHLLAEIDECRRVPRTYISDGVRRQSRAEVGLDDNYKYIKWLAFSFQSVSTPSFL